MTPEVVNNLMAHFSVDTWKPAPTPLEVYADALVQVENAIYELDQAHAVLKSIGCHQYGPSGLRGRLSIEQAHSDAEAVLKALRDLHCDSCGCAVAAHQNGECEEWSY
jgi:hypothetical protein